MPKLDMPTVAVTCHKCGWSYNSRRRTCPVCGAQMLLGENELIKHLETFVDLQGLYISKKEAKKFIKEFKKTYKDLPELEDLWEMAKQLAKIEEMEKKELKELEKKAKQKEREALRQKMRQLEEQKRKAKEEKKKKKEKKKAAPTPVASPASASPGTKPALKEVKPLTCPECGTVNPPDSKFCLECGHKF